MMIIKLRNNFAFMPNEHLLSKKRCFFYRLYWNICINPPEAPQPSQSQKAMHQQIRFKFSFLSVFPQTFSILILVLRVSLLIYDRLACSWKSFVVCTIIKDLKCFSLISVWTTHQIVCEKPTFCSFKCQRVNHAHLSLCILQSAPTRDPLPIIVIKNYNVCSYFIIDLLLI